MHYYCQIFTDDFIYMFRFKDYQSKEYFLHVTRHDPNFDLDSFIKTCKPIGNHMYEVTQ